VLETALQGRTALVTGGASGIGAAIAADLAASGAHVVLADLDEAAARSTAGGLASAEAHRVDVADEAAVDALCDNLLARHGRVDVVVSCAGQAVVSPFLDSDRSTWDRMYVVNLRASMQLTQRLVPAMRDSGWGRLVYISSDGARAGSGGEAAYAAAKSGLFGFAKSIARELARDGVTSNVVCPGPTRTPMLERVAAQNPGLVRALVKAVPLRRLGEPNEVAAVVALLCSDRGGYLTGQTISVSGGITMH
jgi:2-hydroxycyclohexanecarboxyl-CoA dehydrogenase